ncbi:expressed protein [Phakopsora pachyrhizi]|uniref:Expressed protein n=1 Tax=Phakopsora pachyrhizi TaxID=170000 RepID=A0AAV0B2I8_PHAPC|nr:expressed protein [Phakopsora pachyrhizi]
MTDRHLQILEPVSVDQLEVAPHLSPSPRPPALNSDLLPDLHHWRSGMGGGRFTVDSGGGHTLGAIIRGTEGPGVRSYSSLDREDDLDLAVLAGVSGQVSSGGRSSHHESMIGMDDRALSSTECLSADPMLSKDAENSSTAPTPILISIPSISLAELPQDQTGVLLTGLHAQQESPEPCNLSHSLPGHFDSRGNYPPFQLSHNYSSVPSSPDLSLPALGLDYYQSQPLSLEIQSSRDHINQSGICPSDLSDSHVERFQLRNSLLLGSTDLISPTQSDNLLSSSPIISASAPFSQYHLQHPPKGSPISSQISQPYCHVQYKPTPPNIPEVYGYIKSGLHNSTNTHHHSYHPSNSTARSAQLKINTLRVNSLSTQIIPKREENLNFFSHVSSDMSSGVNSFTKPIPHNYSPTSPVNLTHSGFQCTSNRVNLHSSGHSPPLSPTPSPLGLSDANPYKSLHLSNVLQDVPTLKDPSVPNSRNTHKKDVVYISDIKKSDVSKTKIPVHSSPSQTYGTKNEISSRSLHEDIAKTMNNILTSSPPSTATSSSFSPSSPVATTPLSNQNQSLCTKVSSSTNIGYQNLRTTSCNPTDDKFAVELWKLYGPSHQKLPPNSNALESLIRQLKEIGLDVDQIRKRWQSQGKGESNSPEPLAIAQDQCCSGSSSKSDVYNQKSEFLASFRPPEFKKLKTPPLDTLDPVQETKMSFGETPSCELKRGRVPKKALYAPRAGNRPEISPENEM